MSTPVGSGTQIGLLDRERQWPLDARTAIFVLEAGGIQPETTRPRTLPRFACRIEGCILLNRDSTAPADATIYVRDYNSSHVGFISDQELPVGATAVVQLSVGDNRTLRTSCRIQRSRPLIAGWNEGVIHFLEELPEFTCAA